MLGLAHQSILRYKETMNMFIKLSSLSTLLFLFSCGPSEEEGGHYGHHVHHAPHGGQLVELGEHGSGFNLELVLHEDGFLMIYVFDAHVENFVRISANSIDIEIPGADETGRSIICEPVADPITGETIGNTSLFTSTERIRELLPLQGMIKKIEVMEFAYENIEINFSGMPKKSSDEH